MEKVAKIKQRIVPLQSVFTKFKKCQQISALLESEMSFFLKRGYGQTGSKAYLPAFFQFSTNYIDIFSKCFFFLGRLNSAIKSDLTPLHSAHFSLHSAHFALFFQLYLHLKTKKFEKQCRMCAVQCRMCTLQWC